MRNDDSWHDAVIWGFGKFTEVANDKLATAWGDDLVSYATGKKTGFTTEPTDKLADVGNVAFEDKMEDYVNGPVLEGAARILYQIPITGALIEQAVTRVARLQGKSGVSKGIGKAMFMALAKAIYEKRGLGKKQKFKMTPEYMDAYNSV